MATDYSLNFKATLDTDDIQQKIDELKQQESGLADINTSVSTAGAERRDSSLADFEQQVSKITSTIQSLQRALEKFNASDKVDTNNIAKNNALGSGSDSNSVADDTSILMQLKKQLPKISDSVSSSAENLNAKDESEDAIENLSKAIESLQRVIDRALGSSAKNTPSSIVQNKDVKVQPPVVNNSVPLAAATTQQQTAQNKQTKIKQNELDTEIQNYTKAVNKFDEYKNVLKDKSQFSSLFKKYKDSYAELYNSTNDKDFKNKYKTFEKSLNDIKTYTSKYNKGVDMSSINDLTKTQSSISAMKARVGFFKNVNPDLAGVVRANDLREMGRQLGVQPNTEIRNSNTNNTTNLPSTSVTNNRRNTTVNNNTQNNTVAKKHPFRPFGMDEYQKRIAGAGVGFLGSTLAGGMQNVMQAGGNESGAKALGEVSNIFMKTASGGLMGGTLGAGIGLAVGVTETALNRLADAINKTVDEVNKATERFAEAKAKDDVIKNISDKQEYLKAVKNEDLSYFEKKIREEQVKYDKALKILGTNPVEDKSKNTVKESEKNIETENVKNSSDVLKTTIEKNIEKSTQANETSRELNRQTQLNNESVSTSTTDKQTTESSKTSTDKSDINNSAIEQLSKQISEYESSISDYKKQITDIKSKNDVNELGTVRTIDDIQTKISEAETNRAELISKRTSFEESTVKNASDTSKTSDTIKNQTSTNERFGSTKEQELEKYRSAKTVVEEIGGIDTKSFEKYQNKIEAKKKEIEELEKKLTDSYETVQVGNIASSKSTLSTEERSKTITDIELAKQELTRMEQVAEKRNTALKDYSESAEKLNQYKEMQEKILEVRKQRKENYTDIIRTEDIETSIKKLDFSELAEGINSADEAIRKLKDEIYELAKSGDTSYESAKRLEEVQKRLKSVEQERAELQKQSMLVQSIQSKREFEKNTKATQSDLKSFLNRDEKIKELWKSTTDVLTTRTDVESVVSKIQNQNNLDSITNELNKSSQTSTDEQKKLIDSQIKLSETSIKNSDSFTTSSQRKVTEQVADLWKSVEESIQKNETDATIKSKIDELNISKESLTDEEQKKMVEQQIVKAQNAFNSKDITTAQQNKKDFENISRLWVQTDESVTRTKQDSNSDNSVQKRIDELNKMKSDMTDEQMSLVSEEIKKVESAVSKSDKDTISSSSTKYDKISDLWNKTSEAIKNSDSVDSITSQIQELERLKETSSEDDKKLIDREIEKAKTAINEKDTATSAKNENVYTKLSDVWKGTEKIVDESNSSSEHLSKAIEELNTAKESLSDEQKRSIDEQIKKSELSLKNKDLAVSKKEEDNAESNYETTKRLVDAQNIQRTIAVKSLEDIATEEDSKQFKTKIFDIANDENTSTFSKIEQLESILDDSRTVAELAHKDKVELLKEASRADITEEQRKVYLETANEKDIEEKLQLNKVTEARTEIISQLQDRLSNLKAPDMQNVNSLASQGYMISKSDDNARLDMQMNYIREQTNLQREIRDQTRNINTDATFSN